MGRPGQPAYRPAPSGDAGVLAAQIEATEASEADAAVVLRGRIKAVEAEAVGYVCSKSKLERISPNF